MTEAIEYTREEQTDSAESPYDTLQNINVAVSADRVKLDELFPDTDNFKREPEIAKFTDEDGTEIAVIRDHHYGDRIYTVVRHLPEGNSLPDSGILNEEGIELKNRVLPQVGILNERVVLPPNTPVTQADVVCDRTIRKGIWAFYDKQAHGLDEDAVLQAQAEVLTATSEEAQRFHDATADILQAAETARRNRLTVVKNSDILPQE
jgi:hypothetical protein